MPTPAELIKKFTELEDCVEAEQKAFDTWAKPYLDAMEVIRAGIKQEIERLGVKNLPVEEVGTAYLSTTMSAKVDNRADFLKFVTEQNAWNFLDARVMKEPLKAWIENRRAEFIRFVTEQGDPALAARVLKEKEWLEKDALAPPPGIHVEFFTKCHIRRS